MTFPQGSRVPAVVAALHDLAQAMRSAGDVEFALCGPTPKGASRGRTLAVFVGSPGATSRPTVLDGFAEAAAYSEVVDVNCNAVSWSGGSDIAAHLVAVYAIHDALRVRIDADPTLGGVVERSTLGVAESSFPVSDSQGASVELAFTVRASAFV